MNSLCQNNTLRILCQRNYIPLFLLYKIKKKGMKWKMKTEGQVRIPSGCAIAAMISRDGNKMSGETITNAMKPMHDRSNGLGGGFAGYGIYPEL